MPTAKQPAAEDGAQTFIHDTFLGLSPDSCAYDDSRVVLLRVPYDRTACYRTGAAEGPSAIIEASRHLELWDVELQRQAIDVGIHTFSAIEPSADGPEVMSQKVESLCRAVAADNKFVFCLGGDHSISIGAIRACRQSSDGPISVLQIDAHLDLRDTFEGSRYSHACVGRRVLDLPRHQGDPVQLVQVGVRSADGQELEVIQKHGLKPFWGWQIDSRPADEWIAEVVDQLGPQVYVTLDVDGLDPSVIDATGTPVPGGLGWYACLQLLRAVGQQRKVVACDVVELAPSLGSHASSFAAAQLVYRMIGYFVPSP